MSDGVTSRTISIVIAIVFIGFAVTVLASSFYTITKSEIKTRLGIIVSGISMSEIKEIVHLTSSNTLAIFYKDNEYSNIVISPKHFDSFANELRKMAPSIIYRVVDEAN